VNTTDATTTYRATSGWYNKPSRGMRPGQVVARSTPMPRTPLHLVRGPAGLAEGEMSAAVCGARVIVMDTNLHQGGPKCPDCRRLLAEVE
jgi:hypothetical protein